MALVPLLSIQDVSDVLGIPVDTLYRWRTSRKGPTAIKVGVHLRYDEADLRAWIEEQKTAKTA